MNLVDGHRPAIPSAKPTATLHDDRLIDRKADVFGEFLILPIHGAD